MKQENNTSEVGRRLKDVRRVLDISQKDFAAGIDVSGSYLSEIESGKIKPGYNLILAVARQFNVSPNWLLLEQGGMFLEKDGMAPISENDFGDQAERVKELLLYLKKSPLVQTTVLGFVSKFLYENEESIRKDIEKSKTKKIENHKPPPR